MSRSALLSSASSIPSGLLDESGASIRSTRKVVDIDVATLPLIAADALPELPKGIEARLLGADPESGLNPTIVLWSPVHEIMVEVPLQQKDAIPAVAAKLVQAIAFSMRGAH